MVLCEEKMIKTLIDVLAQAVITVSVLWIWQTKMPIESELSKIIASVVLVLWVVVSLLTNLNRVKKNGTDKLNKKL
jgi:hypothetical protein